MTKFVRCLSLVTIAAVLQACGGGSGPATQPNGTAPVITTQPAAVTVASGAPATFSVAATGTPTPAYQWKRNGSDIGGATGVTYAIPAAAPADNGARFTVTATNSVGVVTSNEALLTVNYAPTITTQPAAQTTFVGLQPVFSVAANGNPLPTYQWKRNGTDIAGATASSYTLNPAATLADNGAVFSVTVTNSIGSVTSSSAALTVNSVPAGAPVIAAQPAPSTTVDAGQTVTLNVGAAGTPTPAYQWVKNGQPISGATAAAYTSPALVAADNGAIYTVVVSNSAGSVTSNNATVNVRYAPVITAQPAASTVLNHGASATLSVTAQGNPAPTYQWKRNGTDITGATAASYQIANAQQGVDGGSYTVVVANPVGSVTSTAAAVTVNPPPAVAPAIVGQPAATTADAGQTATFTVSATGTPSPTYQWRRNGVDIGGAYAAAFTTLPLTSADDGAVYSVVVANTAGTVTSVGAQLTVRYAPTIAVQPVGAQSVNPGGNVSLSVTAQGNPTPTYQWRLNGTDVPGATAATYAITNAQNADAGSYTVVVTNALGSVVSNASTLTVNAGPTITVQPADVAVVESTPALFTVTATGTSLTYQWQRLISSVWQNVGSGTATLSLNAPVYADNNAKFRVVITDSNSLSTTSSEATLTVAERRMTIFAGYPGPQGNIDAPAGADARFSYPAGISLDPSTGDFIIADFGNQTIRRMSAAGAVATVAGVPKNAGSNDTPLPGQPSGRFNNPRGVAVASDGTIYVADQASNRIRRISGSTITTLAGYGEPGDVEGAALTARFDVPMSVAVSDTGAYVYVADFANDRIRRVNTTTGAVDTLAGSTKDGLVNSTLLLSVFDGPSNITIDYRGAGDGDDILYVTDTNNSVIRKIDIQADAVTQIGASAGGNSDGNNTTGRFSQPRGVVYSPTQNALFVADTEAHTIRKVDFAAPLGVNDPDFITTIAGAPGVPGSADNPSRFNQPFGIAIDATETQLFVVNYNSDTVSRVTIAAPPAPTLAAFAGSADVRGLRNDLVGTNARFSFPRGIATGASGDTYVADSFNNQIRRVSSTGATTLLAGSPIGASGSADGSAASAEFSDPRGVAVDAVGAVYVADRSNNRIRRISGGSVSTVAFTAAGIDNPDAVVAGPGNLIYVANTGAETVLEVNTTTGLVVRSWGQANTPGYAEGGENVSGSGGALFNSPSGLALTADNNTLYVADGRNRRIRSINLTTGATAWVAGDGIAGSADDANGQLARFENPGNLVLDATGSNLYIVDYSNSAIRRMSTTGSNPVTTVLGVSGDVGVQPGLIPSVARLNAPVGISLRPNGPGTQLLVSDGLEHVILSVVLP